MGKTDLSQRLLSLKKDLEDSKSRRSEFQGQLKGLMVELQEEFHLGSLKEAQKRVQELESQLTGIQNKLNAELEKAEEAFQQ